MAALTLINKKLSYTAEVDTKDFSIKSYCEIQQEYSWSDTHFSGTISDESFSDGFWVPKGVWDNLDLTKTTGTISGTIKLRSDDMGNWRNYTFSIPAKITISKGNDMKHSCGSNCNVNGSWLKLSIDFDIAAERDKIVSSCGYNVKKSYFHIWNVINFSITLNSKEYWSETITQGVSTANTVKKGYENVSDITEAKDLSGYRVYRWDEDISNWSLHHFYPTLEEAKTLRDTLEAAGDKVKIIQLDTAGIEIKTIYETGADIPEEPNFTNRIFGYVKDPLNVGIQFATVSFGGRSSTTNSSGYYEFDDIFYSGHIIVSRYGYESSSEFITTPAEGDLQQDFSLSQIITEPVVDLDVKTFDEVMAMPHSEWRLYFNSLSTYNGFPERSLLSESSVFSGDGSEYNPFVKRPGIYKNDLSETQYIYFQVEDAGLSEEIPRPIIDAIAPMAPNETLYVFTTTTQQEYMWKVADVLGSLVAAAAIVAFFKRSPAGAVGGSAAVTNFSSLKEGAQHYLTIMGTATFALFILEETIQSAAFGVYQAMNAKSFVIAKHANSRLKLLCQQGITYCESNLVKMATPFTVGPFHEFFKTSLGNSNLYAEMLTSKDSGFKLSPGETYPVYIAEVIDGDTFKCYYQTDTANKLVVRWAGINTPEKKFKEGKLSRDYAKSIVEGKTADILMKTKDPYGRYVCTVFIDGENINRKLVEEGMAYAYPEGAEFAEPGYHELEAIAREQKLGIFSILNEYNIMTGDVSITSKPSYCKIFVDDADTGRLTAETIRLTSGGHIIRVEKEGYDPSEQPINIAEGDDKEIRFELTKTTGEPAGNNYGTLKISSKPSYAFIDINGARQLVLTPETLKLPPGNYDVIISKPGFVDERFTITVNLGELQEKRVELAIA